MPAAARTRGIGRVGIADRDAARHMNRCGLLHDDHRLGRRAGRRRRGAAQRSKTQYEQAPPQRWCRRILRRGLWYRWYIGHARRAPQ
jgi:hypothetical protein